MEKARQRTIMDSPQQDFLMARLAEREHETFTLIFLNNRQPLIARHYTI